MGRRNTNGERFGHTNREMNNETYQLRRMVMGYIYEAKKLVPTLPRIEVRITDAHNECVLGTGLMKKCVIWIPAKTLGMTKQQQRHVVFHEILHAAFGIDHNEKCPLMASVIKKTTKKQIETAFVNHANA